MRKVLIPTKLDKAAANLLSEHGYQVVLDAATPLADLAKANSDAEVLIVRSESVTPEIIDLLPKLRLVVRAGAGYNTIDIKYARTKNVDVMNTPGANANAVAEEVVAMMLAAYRHVIPADISTRAGEWEKSKFMGRELAGKTIGILGLGNIGQLVVKRLAGFDMKFLGFDPMVSSVVAEKLNVKLVSVEQIFAESDFVTLHIPETNETRGMVNRSLLETMKPGAVLINCARAGVINEADLRAIKAEKKLVFCNDVYPKDVAGPKSVTDIADIMLPHLGANTNEANYVAAIRSAEQTIAYFDQGITSCVVNKSLPDGLDAKYQQLAYVLTNLAKTYLGKNHQPVRIETSFYGHLAEFAKWMTAPIAAGISADFVMESSAADAEKSLADRGMVMVNREANNDKHYGESMTIDLLAGDSPTYHRVSVRGTVTENRLMISRINRYDGIYLDPVGSHLFIEYNDSPGIIGRIAGILGEKNINIVDIRAPQDVQSGHSLCVIKTNVEVPDILIEKIKQSVNALRAFQFTCKA